MKNLINLKPVLVASAMAVLLTACHDSQKDAEDREKDKVGEIYNAEVQGIDIENRDNQFPASRNDNKEGTGQETGAPSDTIDGDGDKKVQPEQTQPALQPQQQPN